jgi:hypothetical protein
MSGGGPKEIGGNWAWLGAIETGAHTSDSSVLLFNRDYSAAS